MSKSKIFMRVRIEPDGSVVQVDGRCAWTLRGLIAAGKRGLTAIEYPQPRTSAYVHKLRKAGVLIETEHETHGGDFPGSHARYRLASVVTILEESGVPI